MGIAAVTPDQVCASALRTLGLAARGMTLFADEALAASLRRAASFLCPCTPRQLTHSVAEALSGLPGAPGDVTDRLGTLIEDLTGYGDLLELPMELHGGARRLFLGAPGYVRRRSGACLLVGIRPDGASLAGEELTDRIEYAAHARVVPEASDLQDLLTASGLRELTESQWLKPPRSLSADSLLDGYRQRLNAAGGCGDVGELRILDPAAPVSYYRGRWRLPGRADTGDFVARRPQAFGADLWCYARITGGHATKVIDFPARGSLLPGADEAWWLQAAIDATANHPQQVATRAGQEGATIVDFFSPVPSWAQRRLDILGNALPRGRGALFSYALPTAETAEELRFLADMLWITVSYQQERSSP